MEKNKYETEWCLLQNQFESYEKHSLYIKLTSVLVLFLSEMFNPCSLSVVFILLVLWLQDGIWKTFQSRIMPRLMQIENSIRDETDGQECQFNSDYQKIETSGLAKVGEYVQQALRPTVAFPHVALIVIFVGRCIAG